MRCDFVHMLHHAMLPRLNTSRLALHPVRPDDLDALWTLWADPDVRRYLFDDAPVTRARAAAVLEDSLALADEGLGLWIVRLRDAAPVIGCVGLLPVTTAAEYAPRLAGTVEPLAAFHPSAWHRGYATEALEVIIAYGLEPRGLPALAAVIDVPNAASDRLARRLGFVATGTCEGPRHRLRTYVLTPTAFARRAKSDRAP